MTRQNVTEGVREIISRTCPTCDGDAVVLSEETVAIEFDRRLRDLSARAPRTTRGGSLRLPRGGTLARARQTALDSWIRQDAPAATSWIGRIPAGAQRDQLVARLVQHLRQDDPEAARLWADSIGDENLRAAANRGTGP